jgi:hypothetical protein
VEPQEYDEIIRTLVRIAAHQETINEDLHASIQAQGDINQAQRDINQRLTLAIERIDRTLAHVEITQARIETLFARVFRPQDNGQDA